MEEHIKESYLKEQKNPFYILLTLYQGNYGRFALSSLFFVIDSPSRSWAPWSIDQENPRIIDPLSEGDAVWEDPIKDHS